MSKYKGFSASFGWAPYILSSQDDEGVRDSILPEGPGIEILYDGPSDDVPQNILDTLEVDQETVNDWMYQADLEIDTPPSDTLFVHNF